MKKFLLTLSVLLAFATLVLAQVTIESFDNTAPDTLFWTANEGAPSYIQLTNDQTDFVEGTGALRVKAAIGSFHPWGSFVQFGYTVPEGQPMMDWSISDSISIWIKVHQAPTHPEYMVFRIHIADKPTADADKEEYLYENAVILDATSEWVELKVPLLERETDGTVVPNDEGFVLAPTTWGGFTYNNMKLDRDKIYQWSIGLVTSGWTDPNNIPADSLEVSFDSFTRFGLRSTPFIFFNGKTVPTGFTLWSWGQSSFGVEEGAGATPGTNALKWIQGNEWGNGWTGVGMTIEPPYNMAAVWNTDSLKFKMKAEDGVGPIRVQFEDGVAKKGLVFQPIADNQWHDYAFKLSDFVYQDNTSNFDSSHVVVFGIMAEASGIAGKVIYLDDVWTGNPVIDVVPPAAPEGVGAMAYQYYNIVYWQDVPGETGETYTVYASTQPITDVNDPSVDVVATGILEDVQSVAHWLLYPLEDKSVTYYYAVTCMDEAGNIGEAGVSAQPVTNTAQGVATISTNPPADFVADGDFTEWENAGIVPFVLKPETHFVSTGTVTDENDLTATVYLAMDDNYFYIGADVIDDVYFFGEGNWWEQDAFELFIGFYDQRGKKHGSPKRGDEPDYKFVMDQNNCREEFAGHTFYVPGDENYHQENFGGKDYVVETKISLDSVLAPSDKRFHPVRGMRIPIEITFHDNDGNGWEGNLVYSPLDQDNAWQTPTVWSNTWIGDTTDVVSDVQDEISTQIVTKYELSQNYPNPFNPTTTINYSVAKPGLVKIEVYNTMGQKVRTLVNEQKQPGRYSVVLDASDLTSGVYFYKIKADNFEQARKMILMK